MKKLLAVLLSMSMILAFTGCQKQEPEIIATVSQDESESITYDVAYIGIRAHEDGFYSLMSPVELSYYQGELSEIYIDDPTLLAFKVSSLYDGGVYILDLTEGETIINELTAIAEEIDNPELVNRINAIIEHLQQIGPITGAST